MNILENQKINTIDPMSANNNKQCADNEKLYKADSVPLYKWPLLFVVWYFGLAMLFILMVSRKISKEDLRD